MKEATGEVSMTVVTIILIVIVLGIATALFGGANAPGRKWINNTFDKITGTGDDAIKDVKGTNGTGAVDANGTDDIGAVDGNGAIDG